MSTSNVSTTLAASVQNLSPQLQADISSAVSAATQQFGTILTQLLQQELQQQGSTVKSTVQATTQSNASTTTQSAAGGVSLVDLINNAINLSGSGSSTSGSTTATQTTTTATSTLDLTQYAVPTNPLPVPDDIVGKLTYTNQEGVTWNRVGLGVDGVFKYANNAGQTIYVKPDGSQGYTTLSAAQYQSATSPDQLPDKIVTDDGVRSVKVVDSTGYVSYKPDPAVYGAFKGAYNPYDFTPNPAWSAADITAALQYNESMRQQYEQLWGISQPISAVNQQWNQKYGITTA